MTILLAIALGVSAFANVLAVVVILKLRKKPQKKLEITAEDLLHDLTKRGAAVVRVSVIDPSNLLLRSPKI